MNSPAPLQPVPCHCTLPCSNMPCAMCLLDSPAHNDRRTSLFSPMRTAHARVAALHPRCSAIVAGAACRCHPYCLSNSSAPYPLGFALALPLYMLATPATGLSILTGSRGPGTDSEQERRVASRKEVWGQIDVTSLRYIPSASFLPRALRNLLLALSHTSQLSRHFSCMKPGLDSPAMQVHHRACGWGLPGVWCAVR